MHVIFDVSATAWPSLGQYKVFSILDYYLYITYIFSFRRTASELEVFLHFSREAGVMEASFSEDYYSPQ